MNEIQRTERPKKRISRRGALLAGALAAVTVMGGVAANAGSLAVFRASDGSVGIDASHLTPYYEGQRTTAEHIAELNKAGRATININDRALACQDLALYVDTEAQVDAYNGASAPWVDRRNHAIKEAVKAGRKFVEPSGDPCAGLPTTPPRLPAP